MPDFSTDLSSFLRDLQLSDEEINTLREFGDQCVFNRISINQNSDLPCACEMLTEEQLNSYIRIINRTVDIITDPTEQERNEDSDDVICG